MKYSVIDISSNSLSMIIADRDADRTEIVFKDRISLSLPHYMEGRRLTDRGFDKLAGGLNEFKGTSRRLGADACYLISTAALRNIDDFETVRERIAERTGFAVNLLDGKTEAYCDYIANLRYASLERAVLVDLGGKSLEICDLSKKEKNDMLCLDFGLLDLHRKFVARIQPDEEEAERIKKYVRARFDKAELPEKEVFSTVVLVGATNLALYDIYADFAEKEFDEDRRIRYKTFKKLVKELISGRDRSQLIFNNAPEKLYLAGPAAIVLKVLFKRFGVRDIVVSDRGVKEGFLQAVLDGTERGQYYDFASESILGTAREEPAAKTGEKVLAKKNPEKTSAEKRSAAAAEGKTAEGKPVPAAGGRRQTASAGRKKNPAPKAAKAAEEKKTSAPKTVKTAEEKSAEPADPNESK